MLYKFITYIQHDCMLRTLENQQVNLEFWNGRVVLHNSSQYQYSMVKRVKLISLIFGMLF